MAVRAPQAPVELGLGEHCGGKSTTKPMAPSERGQEGLGSGQEAAGQGGVKKDPFSSFFKNSMCLTLGAP